MTAQTSSKPAPQIDATGGTPRNGGLAAGTRALGGRLLRGLASAGAAGSDAVRAGAAGSRAVRAGAASSGAVGGEAAPGVAGAAAIGRELVRVRRWPRRAAFGMAYGAAGLALLVPTSTAGLAWYLASQLLGAAGSHAYPVRVRQVRDRRIALSRTPDLARDIPLGFSWPGGHARLGAILDQDRTTVVREVTEITRGSLRAGIRGYTSGQFFDGDPDSARGMTYSNVSVPGELGDFPAWLVPPTAPALDTWVIAVHGRGGSRGEVLRPLPTIADAGLPTLAVTYRNDAEAPPSPDRCYHLGDTEWQDVAAAIRYARANGARDVILYGWSMGGAITLNLLQRAPEAAYVRAMVLDCPVVDWISTLRMHAQTQNVPSLLTWTTFQLVQRRLRAQLSSLDHRRYASELRLPTLIFCDHDDETVYPTPTLEYARLNPDYVRLVETTGAGHCRSWNIDPERYESELATFLHGVRDDAPARHG